MNPDAIQHVPFDSVDIDAFENCRKELTRIDELAASIRETGLLNPITVREKDGVFYVRAGFRRFAAIQELNKTDFGFEQIPVRVLDGPEEDDGIVNLGENILQESLSWRVVADAVARLKDEGHSVADLATKFGKSQSWVSTRIVIAKKLSKLVQAAVEGEYLTLTEALQLAGLDKAEQEERLEQMLDNPKAYADMRAELRSKRDPRPGIKELRLRTKELNDYRQEEDAEWRAGVRQGLLYAQGADTTLASLFHPPTSGD